MRERGHGAYVGSLLDETTTDLGQTVMGGDSRQRSREIEHKPGVRGQDMDGPLCEPWKRRSALKIRRVYSVKEVSGRAVPVETGRAGPGHELTEPSAPSRSSRSPPLRRLEERPRSIPDRRQLQRPRS